MIDHISLQVTDFAKSVPFYRAALAPLGYEAHYVDEKSKSAGFGSKGNAEPWFAAGRVWISEGRPLSKTHLALKAASRDAVAKFHAAALRAGGSDIDKPGVRADYHENYYAAFVLDPDGNNIEAVTHTKE